MGKYVYIYHAGKETDAGDDAAWGKWFGELGDKMVDAGHPFAEGGKAVLASGVMPVDDRHATGYSIISADSMEEAVELAKGSPLVASTGVVAVYEALPM